MAPPGPGTLARQVLSFISRPTAVKSSGSDHVWPLVSLQRAMVCISSVPGREVSVLHPGRDLRYKTHSRPLLRSTTVAGLAADQSSPACSSTVMADHVAPLFVLRLS